MYLLLGHKICFMRGQKIYKEMIGASRGNGLQRGRSNSLISRRNECLLARYYYYGFHKDVCYEENLRQLAIEFFLSASTLARIIMNNTDRLQQIKEKAPGVYYLQSHWPHMKW